MKLYAEEPGAEVGSASSGAPSDQGQPAESAPASETPSEEQTQASGEESTPKPSGKDRLQKRFSELTRTIHEERAARERAESENVELRRRFVDGGGAQEDKEPKLSEFKEYEEYADARSRWVARQEFRRAAVAARESSAREAATQRATEILARWETAEAKARESLDDYDEVMASPVRFPESVALALLDSDRGPELSYYLKSHPEEVAKLRGLTPVAAARVIGRMETKLDAPAEKPKSSAPPPPRPARPSAPAEELSDKLSDAEWIRRRNKQELDRRRGNA